MKWKKFRRISFLFRSIVHVVYGKWVEKAIWLSNDMEFFPDLESANDGEKFSITCIKSYATLLSQVWCNLRRLLSSFKCAIALSIKHNSHLRNFSLWKIDSLHAVTQQPQVSFSLKIISSLNMCDLSSRKISANWSERE